MRRFRRLRLPGLRWVRWPILLGAVAYLIVRLADAILMGPLEVIAEHEARLRGIDAVNRIVLTSLEGKVEHADLVQYLKDSQGRIAGYHINTTLVNKLASEAATAVRDEFKKISLADFAVPMGALTGSRLLATRGPDIQITLVPVGTVSIDIRQDFRSQGINQTVHRIWIYASAKIRVILPLMSKEVEVTSELPITETIIVGPVPNSFFGGNLGGITVPAGQ